MHAWIVPPHPAAFARERPAAGEGAEGFFLLPEGVENSELPQVSERVVGPGDEFLLQSALGLALSASAAVRKR